jgi:hypothetical protein
MTNTELLDLLREARVSVFHDHEYARIFGTETDPAVAAVPKLADLLARIDAALAERQDSAKDVVEWRVMQDEDGFWEAYPADGETELDVLRCENGLYRWRATVEREEVGFCATEAEAKSAAIAAARALR